MLTLDDILQDIHVLRLPDPPLTVRRLDRRLMAIAPILGRYAWETVVTLERRGSAAAVTGCWRSEGSELRRRRLHARHLPDRGRAPTMESHRNHHRS